MSLTLPPEGNVGTWEARVNEAGGLAGYGSNSRLPRLHYRKSPDPGVTPHLVSPLIGWFTEWYLADYPSCECCTVVDMIALAVNLSVAGAGDYWDDVDRWVRNDFAEQQLTSVDWIYRMASTLPPKPVARNETAERAPERNVGAFAGWSTGNEWGRSIMHCCTGNSTRTLYYVWEHMLEDKDQDELRVNLLLNRASRWVDIYSYIPYEGRVDLKIKQDCRSLWLRAPEWLGAQSPEIMCTVNGTARPLRWEGSM